MVSAWLFLRQPVSRVASWRYHTILRISYIPSVSVTLKEGVRLLSAMSSLSGYAVYDGKKLRYHLHSRELPPLLAVGGRRAEALLKLLRAEFGGTLDGKEEVIHVSPLHAFQVLVWLTLSMSAEPSPELLRALLERTPGSAIQLVLELVDAGNGYKRGKPLIPYQKARVASAILIKIFEMYNYPVRAEHAAHRG